jgi:hypothetical protein
VGITDVHKIRMFPLSLTRAAFNWFTSLPPNGAVELRLSDLMYTETISDYLRWFREVSNRCYNLTIAEKDLADLAFVGLMLYLRDKLDRQEFSDTNQLLQCALPYENCAKSSDSGTVLTRTRKSTVLTSGMRMLMMRWVMRFV